MDGLQGPESGAADMKQNRNLEILEQVPVRRAVVLQIVPAVASIGAITFALSFAGVKIGNVFGDRFEKKAEICGGVILILIGAKILLEHLGILG